jgi:hypothetical protein
MITLPSQRNPRWISKTWRLQRLTMQESILLLGCMPRETADTAAIGIAPQNPRAAIVEANEDKIVYEITFDLSDAGLVPAIEPTIPSVQPDNATGDNATNYDPSQSRRSVVGHQHQPKPVTPRVLIAHCTRS